jgi:hypothetical protein
MKGKTKGLLGCGGCGCLLTILLVVASTVFSGTIVNLLWEIDGSLAQLSPLVMRVLSGCCCLSSFVLLVAGIVFMMKDKKAAPDEDDI